MHIFHHIFSVKESHNPARPVRRKFKSGFLPYLTPQAFHRTFAVFKVPADADPLVLIDIVFFFYAVHHEVVIILFDIA